MKMPWAKVYAKDWFRETQDLSDAEKGRLMDAIMELISDGVPENRFKGNERFVFRSFEGSVEQQFAEYSKNVENGRKGGRKPSETQANPEEPTETQTNPNEPSGTQRKANRRTEELKNRRTEELKNTTPYNLPLGDAFVDFAGDNTALLEALRAFEESRKKNRKPMTARAKELLIGELVKCPPEDWLQMLDNATLHGWQSVYPLKKEEKAEAIPPGKKWDIDPERAKRLREREAVS